MFPVLFVLLGLPLATRAVGLPGPPGDKYCGDGSLRRADEPCDTTSGVAPKPSICLNMIVKDEAAVIERALQSTLPLISDWVIADTGSSDGTPEIIEAFFAKHGVPGRLLRHEWRDFATNRNLALEAARQHSASSYVMFLDADDALVPGDRPMPGGQGLHEAQYTVRIKHGNMEHARAMLVSRTAPCAWHGVLHEYVSCLGSKPSRRLEGGTMYLLIHGGGSRSRDPAKFAKDAETLERALQAEPTNNRYAFYLGQSYRDAAMPQKALEAYLHAAAMPNAWSEEAFYALYQAAHIMIQLGFPATNVTQTFIKAHARSPGRAEAMHGLAAYLRQRDDFTGCFAFAQMAHLITADDLEKSEMLFRETWIYSYGVLDELSVCAYYVGQYRMSLDATEELLFPPIRVPDSMVARVKENRDFAAKALGIK